MRVGENSTTGGALLQPPHRGFAWLAWAFVLAPSPFFACFDGCLGPQVVLPFALVWVPVLTLFSLLSPLSSPLANPRLQRPALRAATEPPGR